MARPLETAPQLRLIHSSERCEPSSPRRARSDAQVQCAIALMRADLAERWTVTRLARRVGLSRPAFARRFVAQTGTSPLRYLSHARMQRAAELLRQTDSSLAHVAEQVGYRSEFAFNRAFKRFHHVAPGTFRRFGCTTTPTMMRVAA